MYFSSHLSIDALFTDAYIPPNLRLKWRFIRSKDNFGLIYVKGDGNDATDYKIEIKDLRLQIRKVLPRSEVRAKLYRGLQSGQNCYLPYKPTKLKAWTIPEGVSTYQISSAEFGILPKMAILAFVEESAFSGNPEKPPFHFGHFNIDHIGFKKNGVPLFPRPFTPNFVTGDCMREFRNVFDSLGIQLSPQEDIGLTLEHFMNGTTIFPISLLPENCPMAHRHPVETGSLEINLAWSAPTTTVLKALLYEIFYGFIKVDKHLNIITSME